MRVATVVLTDSCATCSSTIQFLAYDDLTTGWRHVLSEEPHQAAPASLTLRKVTDMHKEAQGA